MARTSVPATFERHAHAKRQAHLPVVAGFQHLRLTQIAKGGQVGVGGGLAIKHEAGHAMHTRCCAAPVGVKRVVVVPKGVENDIGRCIVAGLKEAKEKFGIVVGIRAESKPGGREGGQG